MTLAKEFKPDYGEKDILIEFLSEIEQNHVLIPIFEKLLDLKKYESELKPQI